MNKEESINYLQERIDLVLNNEVTGAFKYLNGILFHGVPNMLLESSSIDWNNEDEVLVVKNAITKYSANEVSFDITNNGQIGTNEKEY